MLIHRRHILLYLLFALLFTTASPAATTQQNKERVSRLLDNLRHTEGSKRLSIIEAIGSHYWNDKKALYWNQQLYTESIRQDSLNYALKALANLANYYHNHELRQQLERCVNAATSIVRKTGQYSEDYFVIVSYSAERHLWDERYGEAIRRGLEMCRLAKEKRSKDGEIIGSELLGLIYQTMDRNDKAVPYFQHALYMLNTLRHADYSFRAQLMIDLIESYLKLHRLKEAWTLIHDFEQLHREVVAGRYGPDASFPIKRDQRLLATYYMDYYRQMKRWDKVQAYLDTARRITDTDIYIDAMLHYQCALFYQGTGRYREALSHINSLITIDGGNTIEYRLIRADILTALGRHEEAINDYHRCILLQRDSSHAEFDRQVISLQHEHETLSLQLKLKDNQLTDQRTWSHYISILTGVFFLLGAVITFYYMRERKLKKQLARDKQTIEESALHLEQALTKANESQRLKTEFLWNVSHEIRTPLNAIIGFSEVLSSGGNSVEENEQYNHIIHKNCDQLLQLINNLIDVSQLKSDTKCSIQEPLASCDITSFSSSIIDTFRSSGFLNDSVKLSFESEESGVMLMTSRHDIERILLNLLSIIGSTAEGGSITLRLSHEEEHPFLLFVLTYRYPSAPSSAAHACIADFNDFDATSPQSSIGITLARLLIERLGGTLSSASTPETFTISFTHPA